MTPTKIISVLTLALFMTAGLASAQTVDSTTAAATTVNTTLTDVTRVSVDIRDSAFDPHNIVVTPGTTVTWTNRAASAHTVIADNGSFTSGSIPPGGTYSQVFATSGTYLYFDAINGGAGGKGMFGIVVVLPAGSSISANTVTSLPSAPNTGAGGAMAATILLLALSGIVTGAALLAIRKQLR